MKHILDMRVAAIDVLNGAYALLKLSPVEGGLPEGIKPGQFAQVRIPDSPHTFLRRPISICFADYQANQLWLLVRDAGEGTHRLINAQAGDVFNIIMPLGHSFTLGARGEKMMLAGGGVGVAPLLFLGKALNDRGVDVTFALGARSAADLLLIPEFEKYGRVCLSTEDGSAGEKGFVTQHSAFGENYDRIACCGPTPMMQAVARIAKARGIDCEVSLENVMACGIGACLCCVEDTDKGNVCVCTDGPVFNINQLKWQI